MGLRKYVQEICSNLASFKFSCLNLTSFWCLTLNIFQSVSVVDFEQVNVSWSDLESFTGYLRLAPVFVWHSTLR